MPFNSYVFEGRDQMDIGLLTVTFWSNSNVYWDAGNNGTGSYDRVNQTANLNDFRREVESLGDFQRCSTW